MKERVPYKSPYEKVQELTAQLETSMKEFMNDPNGAYQQWLSVVARFHNYSFNNTVLICAQKPDATYVAGYSTWKKLGRWPVKGSHAIRILAPAPYKRKIEVEVIGADGKTKKEEKEITQSAFKVVNVFDVSDTEGKELPQIGPKELTADMENFDTFMKAAKRVCPVPIGFEMIESGAKGYYHLKEDRIAIQTGMGELQTAKTLIHEMIHQKLHSLQPNQKNEGEQLTRNQKEIEAESCAWVVLHYFGFDTSDYSFGYLASWSKDKTAPELRAAMERIRRASSEMINALDTEIEKVRDEKSSVWESLKEKVKISKNQKSRKSKGVEVQER